MFWAETLLLDRCLASLRYQRHFHNSLKTQIRFSMGLFPHIFQRLSQCCQFALWSVAKVMLKCGYCKNGLLAMFNVTKVHFTCTKNQSRNVTPESSKVVIVLENLEPIVQQRVGGE